jgi:hypothetical protein
LPTDPLLPHYIWLTLQKELESALSSAGIKVFGPGMLHPTESEEDWVAFYPLGKMPIPSRQGDYVGSFMFQASCHSRRADAVNQLKTNTPMEVAALVEAALGKKRFQVKKYGAGEEVLGGIRLTEGEQRYTPYRNLTFAGEGNFAVENSNTHTMSVTFTAFIGIHGGS